MLSLWRINGLCTVNTTTTDKIRMETKIGFIFALAHFDDETYDRDEYNFINIFAVELFNAAQSQSRLIALY